MTHFREKVDRGKPVSRFMMKMRVRVTRRLKRAVRRAGPRARSGSAAIEFAFVAPVFFLFLMGTMETGIIYFGDFVLQNAVNDAARQIRTGQVAQNGTTQTQFRAMICKSIDPLLACDDNLQIDVQAYTDFNSLNITNPILANGELDPTLKNWVPGAVCSVVLVRAFYTWKVATPLLTPFLTNMADSKHLLSAAAAFRNEPFDNAVAGC
jgi:Flp pilus assembly protein TadG